MAAEFLRVAFDGAALREGDVFWKAVAERLDDIAVQGWHELYGTKVPKQLVSMRLMLDALCSVKRWIAHEGFTWAGSPEGVEYWLRFTRRLDVLVEELNACILRHGEAHAHERTQEEYDAT